MVICCPPRKGNTENQLFWYYGLFTYDVSQKWRGPNPSSPPCQPTSEIGLPSFPPKSKTKIFICKHKLKKKKMFKLVS